MAEAGTATFRAIADFSKLRSEAQGAKGDLDKLKGAADGVGNTTGPASLDSKLKGIQDTSAQTGRNMSRSITLPVVALGALAVKTFADFDTAIQRTAANANATDEQFARLRDTALDLGAKTQFSAEGAADAMFELSAAGVGVEQILGGTIDSVLLLAGATGSDLAQAAEVVAQSMNAFGIEASESSHVADVLTQAANQSAIDITGLAAALSHAGQLGATANQDLESVVAVLQTMTNQGVPAAQAGTAVAQAMQNLKAPLDKGKTAMKQYGIEVREADGSMKQLPAIIRELEEGFVGLGQAEKDQALDAIFGVEAMKAMGLAMNTVIEKNPAVAADMEDLGKIAGVMGQDFVDAAEQADGSFKFVGASGVEALDALNRASAGTAATFEEKLGKTTARQLESIVGSLETLAIVVVDSVLPAMTALLPKIVGIVNAFSGFAKANPEIVQLGIAFLLLLATVGPVLILFSKVIQAVRIIGLAFKALSGLAAASPWILLLIALVAIGILIYKNWDKVWPVIQKVGEAFGIAGVAVGKFFSFLAVGAAKGIAAAAKAVAGFVAMLATGFASGVASAAKAVAGFVAMLATGIASGVAAAAKAVAGFVVMLATGIASGFMAVVGAVVAVWNAIGAAISAAIGFIVGIVQAGWDLVTTIVTTAVNMVKTIIETAWNLIKTITETVWNGIKTTIETVLTGIQVVVETVLNVVKTIVDTIWNGIKVLTDLVWTGIRFVVETQLAIMQAVVTTVLNVIKAIVETVWRGIQVVTTAVWTAIKAVVEFMVRGIENTIRIVTAAITFLWTSFLNGLKIVATAVWTAIRFVIDSALRGIQVVVSAVTTAITFLWTSFLNGLKAVAQTVWAGIQAVISTAVNAVKVVISGLQATVSLVQSAFSGFQSVASSVWNGIRSTIEGAVNAAINAINRLKSAVSGALGSVGNLTSKVGSIGGKVLGFAFASGGQVPGTGNRDSVPAVLTPGEFVLRKAAVKSIGLAELARMNRYGARGFNDGGYVSSASILRGSEARMVQRFANGGVVQPGSSPVLGGVVNETTNLSIEVNNPVGETTEESLHRSLQKLALHGVLPPSLSGEAR